MKVAHRHTFWYHTVFAGLMAAVLVFMLFASHTITASVIAIFLAAYVGGHIVIHLKRDDLRPDTVVEYVLLGAAIFVVLASAVR